MTKAADARELEQLARAFHAELAKVTSLNAYQDSAMRFHVPADVRLAAYALGVAGEAGEVADLVKKHIGHGHPLDVEKLKRELGDVLWYVAGLAHLHGISLSDVAQTNIEKLEKRYPKGFSTEASIARVDVQPPETCTECGCEGFAGSVKTARTKFHRCGCSILLAACK